MAMKMTEEKELEPKGIGSKCKKCDGMRNWHTPIGLTCNCEEPDLEDVKLYLSEEIKKHERQRILDLIEERINEINKDKGEAMDYKISEDRKEAILEKFDVAKGELKSLKSKIEGGER